MINLTQNTLNDQIYVYVNTLDPDIPFDPPSFLFGFKNGYTNKWSYVVPTVVEQNVRYTVFSIDVTNADDEDPIDGKVALSPTGNWIYKLWATDTATLDPNSGYLMDEGQLQLFGCSDEAIIVSYFGDNENAEATVYLTRDCSQCLVWSTCPDVFNLVVVQWNHCN